MYYTLANINSTNNKFYYNHEEIIIPEESYELCDIELYQKRKILHFHDVKGKEDKEFPLMIRANNNTMRSKIKCASEILQNLATLVRCWDFRRIACKSRDNGTSRTCR